MKTTNAPNNEWRIFDMQISAIHIGFTFMFYKCPRRRMTGKHGQALK